MAHCRHRVFRIIVCCYMTSGHEALTSQISFSQVFLFFFLLVFSKTITAQQLILKT